MKTCAFSQNQSKIDNSANKPKFVYITINNRLPRCCFTIKGVWGCTNCQDVNRYKFGRQSQNMSSLTKPQLFTKGEGCKNPTMPYMANSDIYGLTND